MTNNLKSSIIPLKKNSVALNRKIVLVMPFGRSGSFLIHGILLQQPEIIGPECCISLEDLVEVFHADDKSIISKICRKRYSKVNNLWYYEIEKKKDSPQLFPILDTHKACTCKESTNSNIWLFQIHDVLLSGRALKRFLKNYQRYADQFKIIATTRYWEDNIESCHLNVPYQLIPPNISRLLWALKFNKISRIMKSSSQQGIAIHEVSLETLHSLGYEYLEECLYSMNLSSGEILRKRQSFGFRGELWRGGIQEGSPIGPQHLSQLRKSSSKGFLRILLLLLDPKNSTKMWSKCAFWCIFLGTLMILLLVRVWALIRIQSTCIVCGSSPGRDYWMRYLNHKWHELRRSIQYITQM